MARGIIYWEGERLMLSNNACIFNTKQMIFVVEKQRAEEQQISIEFDQCVSLR